MYPNRETGGKALDQLEPEAFMYNIPMSVFDLNLQIFHIQGSPFNQNRFSSRE